MVMCYLIPKSRIGSMYPEKLISCIWSEEIAIKL